MAKTIQELRKEAGYRSGREFAAALGVSPSTYSRYEASPDSIPLKQAWAMADLLGCSIDMVVGREHVEVADMRGDVQKLYDSLSENLRRRVDEYLEFVAHLQEQESRRREEIAKARQIANVQTLERMFISKMLENPETKSSFLFWTPEKTRESFESFIRDHLSQAQSEFRDEAFEQINIAIRGRLGLLLSDDAGNVRAIASKDPEREEEIAAVVAEATEDRLQHYERNILDEIMAIYDELHPQQETWGSAPQVAIEYSGDRR